MDHTPEPAQSAWDLLAGSLPPYAERVLATPCGDGRQAARLGNEHNQVHGLDPRPEAAAAAARWLASARTGTPGAFADMHREEPFDCIAAPTLPAGREAALAWFAAADRLLAPGGSVLFTYPNRRHWRRAPGESRTDGAETPCDEEEMAALLREAGFEPYQTVSASEGPGPDVRPGPPGMVLVNGRPFPVSGPEDVSRLLASRILCHAVRADYDPLAHARERLTAGRPDLAYEILTGIPQVYMDQPEIKAVVSAEKLACLALHLRDAEPRAVLQLASLAQSLFFAGTAESFSTRQACHAHAEYWHLLGRDDMAARLLRSLQHIDPDPATAGQLDAYGGTHPALPKVPEPPRWRAGDRPRRILMITDNRPNYGLDVLYDGLCRVLGDTRVVEYPRKGTLHGEEPASFCRYPCMFDHPCSTPPLGELLEQVRGGLFDAVLFGDMERTHPLEQTSALARAAGKRLVFLDQLDTCQDTRMDTAVALGLGGLPLCFKREYVAGCDHGPGMCPLPFAYSEAYMRPVPAWDDRDIPVFWAGERKWGLRKLCLGHIERCMRLDFSATCSQEEYARALGRARVSLDFHGFGFDTVRYWEIPAHGGMLLAERRPTVIPLDFEHGASAVFFEDAAELESLLRHYMDRPDEAREIAEAGHRHFVEHHTASARARHLLGWLALYFNWEEGA